MKGTTDRMTTNRYCRGIALAIAALTLASVAHASVIPIFNTGVDANGAPLGDGSTGEAHYSLTGPGGNATGLRVRSAIRFPVGGGWWVDPDSFSAWIGPNSGDILDGPTGHYDYQTTFDLTGLNPATASLQGLWAMDNEGIDIKINGVSTGIHVLDLGGQTTLTGDPFKVFTRFSIDNGFKEGLNTLDFIVNNIENGTNPNPTGLRVEISGTANTPEPASLVLFGAGFAGLFLLRRRLGWAGKLQ